MDVNIPGKILRNHFEERSRHYQKFAKHYHDQVIDLDDDGHRGRPGEPSPDAGILGDAR